STAGNYNIVYTIAATGNNCQQVASAPFAFTVRALSQATISYSSVSGTLQPSTTFCTSDLGTHDVLKNPTTGPNGRYTSTAGLTMVSDVLESADPTSGRITPSTNTPGTYTVTYPFTAPPTGCPNITTTTVVIDEPVNKTIGTQAATVCDGSGTNITVANVDA